MQTNPTWFHNKTHRFRCFLPCTLTLLHICISSCFIEAHGTRSWSHLFLLFFYIYQIILGKLWIYFLVSWFRVNTQSASCTFPDDGLHFLYFKGNLLNLNFSLSVIHASAVLNLLCFSWKGVHFTPSILFVKWCSQIWHIWLNTYSSRYVWHNVFILIIHTPYLSKKFH